MSSQEIIALVVSAVGVVSFAAVFTILYRSYANSVIAELESGQRDVELIEETISDNIKKTKKYAAALEKAKRGAMSALIVLLIPLLLFSLISKFRNGVVMFFDRGIIAVVSGSMSEKHKDNSYLTGLDNQIPTYDLIVVEKVKVASDLRKYDVIAFVNDEGNNIIHRIIGFEYTSEGVKYVTRGDSNNADDKYKPSFDDVIGRYTGESVPMVGLFVMFLQSYSGIITMAAVIYCLLMIEWVGDKIFRAQSARLEILEASIDFKRETSHDESLETSFIETVRFKNIIYTFGENGFISKTVLDEEDTAICGEENGNTEENSDTEALPTEEEASSDGAHPSGGEPTDDTSAEAESVEEAADADSLAKESVPIAQRSAEASSVELDSEKEITT